MTKMMFLDDEDSNSELHARILAQHFGIELDDGVPVPGSDMALVQVATNAIDDAYDAGRRDCQNEMPTRERLEMLDTRFLLEIYLGKEAIRVLLLNEIVRRARSGDDPVIGSRNPF